MEKNPEFINLENLFRRRLFTVPQYQRSYSWKKQHRMDLLDDIKNSFKKNYKTHFMATVVGLRQGEPIRIIADEYQHIDVVDGQQRITTLIILYKAISKELDKTDDNEKKLKEELEETLVKRDETSVLLLQTNHDISNHFVNYIRNGVYDRPTQATTTADHNLLEAIDDCENFVKQWKNNGDSLVDLIAHVKYRLKFIYHEIDDESLVYSVFEVLNSRGLAVSWFDRLKSMLMGMVFDQECNKTDTLDEIHRRWSEIFRIIGIRYISWEILCFAATLRDYSTGRVLTEEKSVDLLVRISKNGCDKIIATIDWIERVARSVVKTGTSKYEYIGLTNDDVRLVAVAIDLRDDLDENEKIELRRYWNKVIFSIYGICRRDGRTHVGGVRLAYDIITKKISPQDIKKRLSYIVEQYPVSKQISSLVREDCYTVWANELRYLLYRYEKHLADESGQKITNDQWNRIWEVSAYTSIEHILPQSSRTEYIHWIGNLFLLPPNINSLLSNTRPINKTEEYQKTGFLMAHDIIEHLSEWNKSKVLERGEKIVQWAKQEWGHL